MNELASLKSNFKIKSSSTYYLSGIASWHDVQLKCDFMEIIKIVVYFNYKKRVYNYKLPVGNNSNFIQILNVES